MRILHLISQKPDYTGSGKYVQEMICQGRSRGHDPFLIAGVGAKFIVPQDIIAADKCRLVRFNGPDLDFPVMGMSDVMPYASTVCSSLTKAEQTAYKNVFARVIASAVTDFQPDIIHSNHLWMATAVAREVVPKLPLVTTCHGSCLRQHHLCPDLGQTLKKSLRTLDRVIALFEQQKADISALLGMDSEKIEIVSGGFNTEHFYFEKKQTRGQEVQILYAGKLDSSKGVPWLLQSLGRVHKPWHLHLVGAGSGPEKKLCLDLAADFGEQVTVHGILSHKDLGALMRKSDIFVLPSFFEGLPLVLLEALACGCRIISTNLPGVRELFITPHPHMVRMVELPRLKSVDRPYKADEPLLKARLAKALEQSIVDVMHGVQPDVEYIRTMTAPFTWEKIFLQIEAVYHQAIQEKQKTLIKNAGQ